MKDKVCIAGIMQNCFRRDTNSVIKSRTKPNTEIKKYCSLEKKEIANGFVEVLEEKDYPINARSVSSYAKGADYRNDPVGAAANGVKRVNLGDITDIQDFIANEPQRAVMVYKGVLEKLAKVDLSQVMNNSEKGEKENGESV